MLNVPLNDLRRIHAPILPEIAVAMDRVLSSGWYLRGRETAKFEAEWADFCGQSHCVSCASGTDALTIAALAMSLKQAAIQANTLPLTAIGLHRASVDLELIDVGLDGRGATAHPDRVPVLLYGRLPQGVERDCRLYDAAHAHGWQPGRNAVACWSFYPSKTLGALGDAGAVTTNDQGLAEIMRDLCGRDDVLRDGRQLTSRMDELQAAVLSVKLKSLPGWVRTRQEVGRYYAENLPRGLEFVSNTSTDLQHLAVIKCGNRDELASYLRNRGIEAKVHFPSPLHLQRAPWGRPEAQFPGSEEWCSSVLSLPCFPGIRGEELSAVVEAVSEFSLGRR